MPTRGKGTHAHGISGDPEGNLFVDRRSSFGYRKGRRVLRNWTAVGQTCLKVRAFSCVGASRVVFLTCGPEEGFEGESKEISLRQLTTSFLCECTPHITAAAVVMDLVRMV